MVLGEVQRHERGGGGAAVARGGPEVEGGVEPAL